MQELDGVVLIAADGLNVIVNGDLRAEAKRRVEPLHAASFSSWLAEDNGRAG
jgi:hypothetical protein